MYTHCAYTIKVYVPTFIFYDVVSYILCNRIACLAVGCNISTTLFIRTKTLYDFNRVTRSSGEWRHHLGLLDEGELFMELIRDVSNELDIDVLCHKILVNVGILTRADRGSLFLVRGRHLVAKLFDVTVDTGKNLFVYYA